LVKQVFVNEDGSTGILYLVTNDTTLSYDGSTTLYRTRWNVEPYHKSLKQNASLEKSEAQTVVTQTNHFFAALCAFIKLELLEYNGPMNSDTLNEQNRVECEPCENTILTRSKPKWYSNC
jgi:hypothetical protein